MLRGIQEHAPNNLCQDALGGTGNTCIIKQMASPMLSTGKQIVGQPTHQRTLIHATRGLQEFHSPKHSTILVLPTSTCGKELFENERTVTDFVLVPIQSTEIGHGTQHRRSKDRAGTQARTGRDGRQQRDFNTRPKFLQLFFQ